MVSYFIQSGGVVSKHYTIATKIEKEALLLSFTHSRYILPAEAKILTILNAGPQTNFYEFDQPLQKPARRALEADTKLQPALKRPKLSRVCNNKKNSKR